MPFAQSIARHLAHHGLQALTPADRADLGGLRACELVGLRGANRVMGPSAPLARNPLALVEQGGQPGLQP